MTQKSEELKVLKEFDAFMDNWPAIRKRRRLRANVILIVSWFAAAIAFSLVNYNDSKQVIAVSLAMFSGDGDGDQVVSYAPLWVKTNGSLLEGASHPEELVDRAAELGLGTLAIIASLSRRLWPERTAFAVAAFGLNPSCSSSRSAAGTTIWWSLCASPAGSRPSRLAADCSRRRCSRWGRS